MLQKLGVLKKMIWEKSLESISFLVKLWPCRAQPAVLPKTELT